MSLSRLIGQRIAWLKAALNDEVARPMRPLVDSEETRNLFIAVSRLEEEMRCAATSRTGETAAFETRTLVLALEIQAHAQRHSIAIARSRWGGRPPAVRFDQVFFSGRLEIGMRLEQVCEARRLRLAPGGTVDVTASDHSRHLAASAGAILDVGGHQAWQIAEAYYLLGFATAVGVPAMLLARKHQELAVDLGERSVSIDEEGPDEECLSAAIELAICRPHRVTAVARLTDTLAEVERLFGGPHQCARVVVALAQARRAALANDPTEFRMALEALLDAGSDGRLCLIYPRQPATYPRVGQRRVLHVTPLHPGCGSATGAVESACVSRGFRYARWEVAPSPAPSDRIWQDIGRASLVVVDLTGLDPRVTFHLGMAHAQGKETLLVINADAPASLAAPFPAIAAERVHAWWDGAELYGLVVHHLANGEAARVK